MVKLRHRVGLCVDQQCHQLCPGRRFGSARTVPLRTGKVMKQTTPAKTTCHVAQHLKGEIQMKPRNLPSIYSEADERCSRTDAHLGPSDSSDSVSDLAGLNGMDDDDLNASVDIALREDGRRSLSSAEVRFFGASDSAGTGESRSAVAEAGVEAADVGVDRAFTLGRQQGGGAEKDEYQDAAFTDLSHDFGSQQSDDVRDEEGGVSGVGPAGEWVATKGRGTRSNESKEKS